MIILFEKFKIEKISLKINIFSEISVIYVLIAKNYLGVLIKIQILIAYFVDYLIMLQEYS